MIGSKALWAKQPAPFSSTLLVGILVVSLTAANTPVSASGQIDWQDTRPMPGLGAPYSMLTTDPNGERIIATFSEDYRSFSTVAFDPQDGTPIWDYAPLGLHVWDQALSPNGSRLYLAVGSSSVVVAVGAASGAELWRASDSGLADVGGTDVDAAGTHVFVSTALGLFPATGRVRAFDASSGAQEWGITLHGNTAGRLVASPNGTRVYVLGYWEHDSGRGFAVTALRASSGAELWTERLAPSGGSYIPRGLETSADGRTVFAVANGGRSDRRVVVALRSRDGYRRWLTSNDVGSAWAGVVVDDSGHLFVSGDGYRTTAYRASDGRKMWTSDWDGGAESPSVSDVDWASDMAVGSDSRLFVAGLANGGSGCDEPCLSEYGVIALDVRTGKRVWTALVAKGDHAVADTISISPDAKQVFVSGKSGGNFETLALNPPLA